MNAYGFNFLYPMLTNLTIFGGSVEFVVIGMLFGAFDPLKALILTLIINARHLFYGIPMLEKYRVLGFKLFYLIFGLCDESFSINCVADIPEDVDKSWFMILARF